MLYVSAWLAHMKHLPTDQQIAFAVYAHFGFTDLRERWLLDADGSKYGRLSKRVRLNYLCLLNSAGLLKCTVTM